MWDKFSHFHLPVYTSASRKIPPASEIPRGRPAFQRPEPGLSTGQRIHPLHDPLHDPLNDPHFEFLYDSLHDPLNNPLHDPMHDPLHDPLDDPHLDLLHDPLRYPQLDPLARGRSAFRRTEPGLNRRQKIQPLHDPLQDPHSA